MVIGCADNVVTETECTRVDRLRVTLENVHRVNGRGPEVAESKGRIHGGSDEQLLGGVGGDMRQLLVMSCEK